MNCTVIQTINHITTDVASNAAVTEPACLYLMLIQGVAKANWC